MPNPNPERPDSGFEEGTPLEIGTGDFDEPFYLSGHYIQAREAKSSQMEMDINHNGHLIEGKVFNTIYFTKMSTFQF